jgi:uncharacterized protein (TIGR02246 family)
MLQVNSVTAQDNSDLKSQIQSMNDKMASAVKSQDMNTVMDFYADDAVSMPSYQPMLKGKEAIKTQNEKDMKEGSHLSDMKLNTQDVYGSGNLVYEVGTYNVTYTSPENSGQTMKDNGKYLTVWEKQNDRQWKIKAEIWNTDRSPREMMEAMEHNNKMMDKDKDEMTGGKKDQTK